MIYLKNKIIYICSVILSLFIGISGTLLVVYYIPSDEGEKVVQEVTITESDTVAPAVNKAISFLFS